MEAGLLWLHVLSGVAWIGSCAALAIGSGTLSPGSAEFRDFASRGVPALTRLAVLAASVLLLSGGFKLISLGSSIGFQYPAEFIAVLAIKGGLFVAMAFAMVSARRAATDISASSVTEDNGAALMKRVGIASASTVVMGAIALGLGMWLAGAA